MSQSEISYLDKVMETTSGGVVTYLKQIDEVHHEVQNKKGQAQDIEIVLDWYEE